MPFALAQGITGWRSRRSPATRAAASPIIVNWNASALFSIGLERKDSISWSRMNSAIVSEASTISSRYARSRRIDAASLGQDLISQTPAQCRLRDQIDFLSNQLRQLLLRVEMPEEADLSIRHELDQQINIAVGPHLTANGRPEQIKLLDLVAAAD